MHALTWHEGRGEPRGKRGGRGREGPQTVVAAEVCANGRASVRRAGMLGRGLLVLICTSPQVSDVIEHSKIDLDIKDIQSFGSEFSEAKKLYEGGKNSKKSEGLRNLQAFSTSFVDSASKQAEPMAKLGHAFWGRWDFGDALVTAALDGKDDAQFGNYATGSLASTADARKQVIAACCLSACLSACIIAYLPACVPAWPTRVSGQSAGTHAGNDTHTHIQVIKKGIKFSVVWLYALHEMESAIVKYKEGKYEVNGAPHALDEVWAFYAGSLEQGDASGYGPYIAGEKNGKKFGTYGYETGTSGRSRVTLELLYQLTAMQRYLQTEGNLDVLESIAKCVRAQFKVPLIQGCLSYAHASSSEALVDAEDLAKMKAEAWAYCVPILPSLNEADPANARKVQATVSISSDARPDWEVMKTAFSTLNLNKMGIMCEDIGYLGSNGYNAGKFVETAAPLTDKDSGIFTAANCQDDAALISANPSADSSKCAAVKMPKCGSSIVCSSSVRLQSSRVWALAIFGLCFLYMFPY